MDGPEFYPFYISRHISFQPQSPHESNLGCSPRSGDGWLRPIKWYIITIIITENIQIRTE